MHVDVIVHCWAAEINEFAMLLNAQLSSLVACPPKRCLVNVKVCTAIDDNLTHVVVGGMKEVGRSICGKDWPVNISLSTFSKSDLFRRGIARNRLSKSSTADIVYYADCDYYWGDGFWDALIVQYQNGFPAKCVFPRQVFIHKTHSQGDAEIARVVPGKLFVPDLTLFEPRTEKMAIGGIQIVRGETARQEGYCDGTKWINPVSEEGGFRNTTEDKVFRNLMGGSQPIDIPNLFRQRHSGSAWQTREQRLAQTDGKA